MDLDRLMVIEEVSAACRIPVATLRYWRWKGTGPASFKLGKRVVYRERDVAAWMATRRREAAVA